MKTVLAAAAALLTLSVVNAQASTANFFVFGDSLNDSGNLNLAVQAGGGTGINGLPVQPGLPPRSYPAGQFTNGDTWATQLGLSPSLLGGTNYSYGGATAVRNGDTIPDLKDQIKSFRTSGTPVNSDSVAAILVGGNDFRAFDPNWSQQQINKAVRRITRNIAQGVKRLHRAGISEIIVLGLAEADVLPPSVSLYNKRLTRIMARLDKRLADSDIRFFDTNSLFQQILFQASQTRQLSPVPCIYDPQGCAAAPENYVFYDEIHPSEWVHSILAEAIANEIGQSDDVSAVPLPATAPLLLFGLGGAVFMLRRRKSHA